MNLCENNARVRLISFPNRLWNRLNALSEAYDVSFESLVLFCCWNALENLENALKEDTE